MPAVNPSKQAHEKWQASLKELERRSKDLETDPNSPEKRTAFDEQMKAVDEAKSNYGRFKDYESRMAAGLLDADLQNPDRKSAEELAGMTELEKRSDKVNPLLNPDAKGYSLARALDAQAQGKPLTGVELEVSKELQKRNTGLGRGSRDGALSVPMTLNVRLNRAAGQLMALARLAGLNDVESRALTATTGSAAIPTILDTNIIEMLRAKVIMSQAGATILTGITGVFDMPKQSAQPSVTIGGESVTQSESAAQVASKVTFTPKTITGNSKVTRRFMVQAMQSLDVENFMRMMILYQIALGIDTEAINGPGTANRATGILQTAGVTTVALGTNGGAATFAKLVEMETNVADANGDGNSMAYLTNAKGRGHMKTVLKASAAGSTMLWENNVVNGYPGLMCNLVPKTLVKGTSGAVCSGVIFGDFARAVIALWSGVDIVTDPYTGGNEGATSIYAHQDFDFQLLYAEAFSKIVDLLA